MFRNILLCSDGSQDAMHATHLAALFTRQFQSQLTLLNVFNPTGASLPMATAPEAATYAEIMVQYEEEVQQDIINCTRAVLADEDVAFEVRREIGNPVEVITRIAETEQHDLIVMGCRGLGGLQRLLLGSVSDGVLHHAPCPVLITRGETIRFQRVLAATDGSDGASHALCAAAEIARQFHAPLTLLHAFEPDSGAGNGDALDTAVYALRVRQVVTQHAEDALEGRNTDFRLCQEIGHPVETITRFADSDGSDLIVMGSRGRGMFQRFLIGSVSDGVTHRAHCPVLIVR